jgi:predicted site-specific integrase-resolvase
LWHIARYRAPEQEMVRDMMTLVHRYSSRLYGLRNYRKKLNEALKEDMQSHAAGPSNPA